MTDTKKTPERGSLGALLRHPLRSIGVGRPTDPFPPRRPHHRYLVGDHVTLSPWTSRFRYGYVLCLAGPFWNTAIGVVGPDFEGGNWLGGMSWKQHGAIAVCRSRRRGSWLGDRRTARNLASLDDDDDGVDDE